MCACIRVVLLELATRQSIDVMRAQLIEDDVARRSPSRAFGKKVRKDGMLEACHGEEQELQQKVLRDYQP